MGKKHKCQVVIEDAGGVTVRRGNDIVKLLSEAIRAHVDDPLVLLAVVTACVSVDCNVPEPEDAEEAEMLADFTVTAAAYAGKVTARWDAEAEADMDSHAGNCECGECCGEPALDDRDRLLEEEVRAASKAYPSKAEGEQS